MSLISVVRDVCAVVGVAAPSSVFASIGTNRTMLEMLACANEMAQRIAYDTRDWTELYASVVYTGNSVTTTFTLPANYKRMLVSSHLWLSGSTQRPAEFISDIDEWMQRRATSSTDAWGEWIIYGGQIHIWPVMSGGTPLWTNSTPYAAGRVVRDAGSTLWACAVAHTSAATGEFADERVENPHLWVASSALNVATTAHFTYVDKNCISLASVSGGFSDRFLSDDDTFRLDERLLKLGMIYEWKSKKGSPYAEDMGTFSDALAMEAGRDRPAPVMIFSGRSGGMHAYY